MLVVYVLFNMRMRYTAGRSLYNIFAYVWDCLPTGDFIISLSETWEAHLPVPQMRRGNRDGIKERSSD